MKKILAIASVSLLFGLSACGGGGGGSSSSGGGANAQKGFSVPTEISAVPTNLSGSVSSPKPGGFKSKLMALHAAATDAGTDYSNAQTTKFVEEHALDQFSTVEDIMKSLAQTHYADAANLNKGPYKAMVSEVGNNNGSAQKQLQPWVVDSAMVVEGDKNVNRVRVWIDQTENGVLKPIKAEFKISASATKKADGSYSDYGVWTLNAGLGATDSFTASASVGANGEAIVKVHELHTENSHGKEMQGILNKSDTSGFGKVIYPDWNSCNSPNCDPPPVTAEYIYDAAHVAVKSGTDLKFKDRTAVTDMTHRYGMYDNVTGQDVLKVKSFGFPVQYTDTNGVSQFAYYGAWQGQHQLWANGGTVPAGTVVTRQDRNSNQTAESYTVSQPFLGTLVKRTLIAADISDILNIPVEIFVNANYNLQWNGTNWVDCRNMTFGPGPGPTCEAGSSTITDFSFLVANPNDHRKFIGINHFDNITHTNADLMYDPNGGQGAGFYVATRDQQTNTLTNTGTKFAPSGPGDQLFVNIGGSIYIMYTGTGWVQKALLSFDQTTYTPTFDPVGDTAYTPDLNREYYINNQGANYVVTMTSPGVYVVKSELQSVANPVNVATFLPAGTYFKPQFDNGSGVTYKFITDSASANFLKLVYKSVGTPPQPSVNIGDVVTEGQWGLMAFDINDVSTGVQFNWNYPSQGQTFGTLTYLIDANNAYKLLDDPIRLAPITLTNHAGESKTLALQFDGWMGGLPDLYQELQKNNFVMTADIADKVINIPAGTPATDAADSTKGYLIKPLEMSEFLNIIADPGNLNIATADAVDLATVPTFVDPGMGAKPATTGVKYSEGNLVE